MGLRKLEVHLEWQTSGPMRGQLAPGLIQTFRGKQVQFAQQVAYAPGRVPGVEPQEGALTTRGRSSV